MSFPNPKLLTRAAWLKIHLYLALGAGLFFAIMGLTGSISVYREELDELLNPQLVIEQPQGKYQSLDKILAAVQQAHPDRYGSWTLEMPRSPHSMMTAWFEKPRETYFEFYAPLMVSVNPYTAEVVASRFWGQTATTWLLDLHTQLQLARPGWNAVGVLGLLLMVSVSTGLYLWWPGLTGLRQALKIRHNAGMMQLLFDLHRMTGLLSAAALLLLAVTGFLLAFPALMETLTGASGMAHGETGRTIISTAIPNNHPTRLEAAEFVARGAFPRAQLRRITTPAGDTGIYRINLRQNNEINQRHPFTTVWIDRWSGQIKEVRDPYRFSSGERFMTWLWPLHTGEALGATGRFTWFLTGLVLFFLYITGLLRWLYRTGKIQDRAVDFSPVRKHCYRLTALLYCTSLMLFRLSTVLVQKMTPLAIQAYTMLLQCLKRLMANRQKRLGKK
ncbi:MAG: PepSY-associated TM helix domain-containing protein [Methylococcaceae bacterium]